MRPSSFLTTAALLCTPCFAAPPRMEELQDVYARALEARQQSSSTSYDLSLTLVQGNTATTSTTVSASVVVTTNSAGSTVTSTASVTVTNGGSNSGSNSNSSSSEVFDPRLPAGGIAMITPNTALAVPTYYKIQDWVTFAWNYTSLSVTPSAVDILASCSANRATYTIAANQSIPTDGSAQTVLWDTGAFQASATVPLLTETYTLIIHEAGQPVTARASAGYLAPFAGLTFGMYSPKAATPLADFVCVGCSGGITNMEKQTVLTILGVAGVTVASFTWYAGLVGLW